MSEQPVQDAVVFTAVNEVETHSLPVRPAEPGEVLVQTKASVISAGTEGWILEDRFTWKPTDYPTIPGYQRVGIVEAVGDGVDGIRVGDRVAATRALCVDGYTPFSGAHQQLAPTPSASTPGRTSDSRTPSAFWARVASLITRVSVSPRRIEWWKRSGRCRRREAR